MPTAADQSRTSHSTVGAARFAAGARVRNWAHRVILLPRSNWIAFGVKRTQLGQVTEPDYEYAP